MNPTLKKELRKARPSLRMVSPVSFWFILLMGVFNLIIGVLLMTLFDAGDDEVLKIITLFVPAWLWGGLFFSLGLAKVWSLHTNNWKWSRWTLLAGVALKSGWAVALIIRTFYIADNAFLALCWLAIALTQIICYIHFLPPQEMRLFGGKRIQGDE